MSAYKIGVEVADYAGRRAAVLTVVPHKPIKPGPPERNRGFLVSVC